MSILDRIQEAVRTASPEHPRCPTPLRPSAGLVGRIPNALSSRGGDGNASMSLDDIPFCTDGPSAASNNNARHRKPHKPLPNAASKSAAAAPLNNRSGGDPFTLHASSSEDAFSAQEKRLVSELNLLRGDPAGYAKVVEHDATVCHPFVPAAMTHATLTQYATGLAKQRDDATEKLEELTHQKKKELATMQAEWVAEDLEKAKKAKKGAPGGKKGVTPEPEMDTDRTEAVAQLEKRYAAQQRDVSRSLENASTAFQAASQGLKMLRDCIAKLQTYASSSSLPSVLYNRGLSLAARELCMLPGQPTVQEARDLAKHYGETGEKTAIAQHHGVTTVRQSVMELLMGLQDPRKNGRNALLDPSMTSVGCGWRKRSKNDAVTTFLLTSGFEELDAIHARPYMSLDDVRRMLPLTTSSTHATTIVKLQTQLPVSIVSPVSHPVECGNETVVLLRCGADVQVCGSLLPDKAPNPSTPLAGCGDVFVQQSAEGDGVVEARVVLPARGMYRLVLFARGKPTAVPTMVPCPFHNIGAIRLQAAQWHSSAIVPPFPSVTSDFDDRRCTLIGPLEGTLRAGALHTFELVIPLSTYLKGDIQRIDNTLRETMSRLGAATTNAAKEARQSVAAAAAASETATVEVVGGGAAAVNGGQSTTSHTAMEHSASEAAASTTTTTTLEEDIEAAKEAVVQAKQKQESEAPTITAEIASLTRDSGKKKGKELDRVKAQVQEMEDALAKLGTAVERAERLVVALEEKLVAQRRAEKRTAAQVLRFQREKQTFEDAADRRGPLRVQLSLEERRADFAAVDHEFTVYRLETRVPKEPGPVTIFINGLAAVMYTVTDY